MSILTRNEILSEMKRGAIKIEPFSVEQVGPASVDLHLSKEFKIFKNTRNVIEIRDDASYDDVTEKIKIDDRSLYL